MGNICGSPASKVDSSRGKVAKNFFPDGPPTISYFKLYGRASALHFQFEHAGQPYYDEQFSFEEWPARKMSHFGGSGLPVVTFADKTQMNESLPLSIFFAKKFGQYPSDPL
jgi:hypothetical protein